MRMRAPRTERHKLARAIMLGVFAVWAASMVLVGAYLMAGHLIALPVPSASASELTTGLEASRARGEHGYFALHVLYDKCGCSQRIADHLLVRGPRADVAERVALVGGDPVLADRLRARGFSVELTSSPDVERRYGITSVPTLAVMDPSNVVKYVGGYTATKRGPAIADDDVLDAVVRGEAPPSMPVFGCAISRELSKSTDPLGVRQ